MKKIKQYNEDKTSFFDVITRKSIILDETNIKNNLLDKQ